MGYMNLKNRFANTWTGLGVLLGIFIGLLYRSYTTDIVRALLYGTAAVLFGVLVFNFVAFLFSDAFVFFSSTIISLVRLRQYRYFKIQRREREAHWPHPGS